MKKMKISCLFHWLYGALMIAPLFAIASTVLVNVFNKNDEEVKINYKYETNDVNSIDDLIIGNAYHFEFIDDTFDSIFDMSNIYYDFEFFRLNSLSCSYYGFSDIYWSDFFGLDSEILFTINGDDIYNYFTFECDDNVILDHESQTLDNYTFTLCGDFILRDINGLNNFNNFSKCENIPIQSVEINNSNINDIFYTAVDKVKESSLFSWANDSFLTTPFRYITNLFNMPNDSVAVQLLSYWCAISIVWLVFDLIMYVPNLAHSWIDKGGIE